MYNLNKKHQLQRKESQSYRKEPQTTRKKSQFQCGHFNSLEKYFKPGPYRRKSQSPLKKLQSSPLNMFQPLPINVIPVEKFPSPPPPPENLIPLKNISTPIGLKTLHKCPYGKKYKQPFLSFHFSFFLSSKLKKYVSFDRERGRG